jgi:sugar phosphate isomerase/epimerase
MKVGVFLMMFSDLPFEQALDAARSAGVEAVEIGCGAYALESHCRPARLLADPAEAARFKEAVLSRDMTISALSAQGNPLHPDPAIAVPHRAAVRDGIALAAKLGVPTFVAFSGCPGGCAEDRTSNWIVFPSPPAKLDSLKWQWEQVLIPYWRETMRYAEDLGVRVALELHPDNCVYGVETLLALRDALGTKAIGANFDPSHLFWQGVDPAQAIRALGDSIFHFHAKDTAIDPVNCLVNGVLELKPPEQVAGRSWNFCTVGYGHGEQTWRDMVRALRLAGYDGALSIEYEDVIVAPMEGLQKAVRFLKPILFEQ